MTTGPPSGARLGTALTDLSARARVKAREVTLPLEQAMRDRFQQAFMERLERDLHDIHGPAFTASRADVPVPEHLAGIVDELAGPGHFAALILLAGAAVGVVIGIGQAAASGYLQRLQRWAMQHEGNLPLSPEEAAVAVLKGAVGLDWAADEANGSGMQRGTFESLLRATGNPPGPQELMAALTRGVIDEERFALGIREGQIRNEWTDVLLALRHAPLPAGVAVSAAVQNHIDFDQLAELLNQNGISPAWATVMYETAGRPPGIQELLSLWNRGEVDQPTVEQAIRESDVKDKYIPAILASRRHLIPERSVVSMLRHGVLDDAQGAQHLEMLGLHADDVAALVGEAHQGRQAAGKQLAVGQIIQAYEDGLIDRETARARIVAVQHPDADAVLLLDLADDRRTRAYVNGAVARLRTLYVGYRIDHAQTSGFLDQLQVRADQRDHWLALWTLERDANQRDLTPAQIGALWARSLFDDRQAVTRLVQLGYTADDAVLLLELQHPKPKGGRVPQTGP